MRLDEWCMTEPRFRLLFFQNQNHEAQLWEVMVGASTEHITAGRSDSKDAIYGISLSFSLSQHMARAAEVAEAKGEARVTDLSPCPQACQSR